MGYYNQQYFDWQKSIGEFGRNANVFKFPKFINSNNKVIDFGCGGGYLLKKIEPKEKLEIEINYSAREIASKNVIAPMGSIEEVQDNWADMIISNLALELVHNPLEKLKNLIQKIKPGGKFVLVVPQECKEKYKEQDINNHLYTWTPQLLGNLFKTTGYKIITAHILQHHWAPFYQTIHKFFGWRIFHLSSRIYNYLFGRNLLQTRIIAKKSSKTNK